MIHVALLLLLLAVPSVLMASVTPLTASEFSTSRVFLAWSPDGESGWLGWGKIGIKSTEPANHNSGYCRWMKSIYLSAGHLVYGKDAYSCPFMLGIYV